MQSHVLALFVSERGDVPNDEFVARESPSRARFGTFIGAGEFLGQVNPRQDDFDLESGTPAAIRT